MNTLQNATNKRILLGQREIKKHMKAGNILGLIVAKNMSLDQWKEMLIQDVTLSAADQDIPIVFALTRRGLSRIFLGDDRAAFSCIGILRTDGVEMLFDTVKELALRNQILWRKAFASFEGRNPRNENCIWVATFYGYRDNKLLRECVDAGFQIDEPDSVNGETPLMIAVQQQSLHWVQEILYCSPDLELRSFSGENVFFFAARESLFEIWKELYESATARYLRSKVLLMITQKKFNGESPFYKSTREFKERLKSYLGVDNDWLGQGSPLEL